MQKSVLRAFVLVVALSLAVGACSRGTTGTGAQKPKTPSASATATGKASETPGSVPTAAFASPTATASGKPEADRPCNITRYQSSTAGDPGAGGTYIATNLSPRAAWGRACPDFSPGQSCTLSFSGAYRAPGERAYVRFEAWYPRGKEPAITTDVGPLAGEGSFDRMKFPVTVPHTEAVLVRLVLLNQDKQHLADGDSFVIFVDCKTK